MIATTSSMPEHLASTATVRFYDSTFYTIALTSVTYLIFQTYSIRPYAHRLILFISFLCSCLSCETFFHIFRPNSLLHFANSNITNYFSPAVIHLTLLLSISSFLWNATQCAALATILLPTTSSDKQLQQQQPPNFVLRRWLRHVCVDHVFALLLVRLGRLTDVATVTALSDMASICVITSWCSQIAVFPCMVCFLHSLFVDTTIPDSKERVPSTMPPSNNTDEFNSVLHRLKIIKIMGLALFGLKISALSLCETLALALTAAICLSCLVVAPPGREMSKYTRIFDIFIGKVPGEEKGATLETEHDKAPVLSRQRSGTIREEGKNREDQRVISFAFDLLMDLEPCAPNPMHRRTSIRSSFSHLKPSSSTPALPVEAKSLVDITSPAPPPTTTTETATSVIDYSILTDTEILSLIKSKKLAAHNLERYLPLIRAVHLRRLLLDEHLVSAKTSSPSALENLPYEHYDYSLVINQCCENVIGYVPIPVGYAGPLRVDDQHFYIPLATTEGNWVCSLSNESTMRRRPHESFRQWEECDAANE